MTTGTPSSRAAASLGASRPPLSLVTSTSMACSRSRARSPSRVNGPRSSSTRIRRRHGRLGRVDRAHQEPAVQPARRPRGPVRPVVRNTRSPCAGNGSAAAARSATGRQSSPGTGVHAGRCSAQQRHARRARRPRPRAPSSSTANGCVASTTASVPCARSHAARPSTPAEPADPHVPGSGSGRAHPAGQRDRDVACVGDQLPRQQPRLGGAAQQEHPHRVAHRRRRSE